MGKSTNNIEDEIGIVEVEINESTDDSFSSDIVDPDDYIDPETYCGDCEELRVYCECSEWCDDCGEPSDRCEHS